MPASSSAARYASIALRLPAPTAASSTATRKLPSPRWQSGGLSTSRSRGSSAGRSSSLPLLVDASTLVPRPETETVVEAALAAIDAGGPRARPLRIADLGTGSGAILLALLSELPNASGVGTDVSVPALSIARNNARGLGLERAKFLACDIAAALRGPFDVIVSNPPYIASPAIAALAPEVRDYDPRGALDGGTDGLDFYRYIAAAAPPLLAPGGALIVELGAGQSQAVAALFAAGGLVLQPPYPDLSGVPRALVATRA